MPPSASAISPMPRSSFRTAHRYSGALDPAADIDLQPLASAPPSRSARRTSGTAAGRPTRAHRRNCFLTRTDDRDLHVAKGGLAPQLVDLAIDQLAKVDLRRHAPRRGVNFRSKVEIVDRGQQQPRLLNDLGWRARDNRDPRAQILPLDDFGEADDRVQWRLDLVHQLPQRGRVSEHLGERRQLRG